MRLTDDKRATKLRARRLPVYGPHHDVSRFTRLMYAAKEPSKMQAHRKRTSHGTRIILAWRMEAN